MQLRAERVEIYCERLGKIMIWSHIERERASERESSPPEKKKERTLTPLEKGSKAPSRVSTGARTREEKRIEVQTKRFLIKEINECDTIMIRQNSVNGDEKTICIHQWCERVLGSARRKGRKWKESGEER